MAKTNNHNYQATIGIECHVQLKTRTKLFAAVDNDARAAAPNTLISHICLGMPGALPVLNEAAIGSAIKVALAFNTTPQKHSIFERKHYFYPDLPKGYQITQLHQPIIQGGYVEISVEGQGKKVELNRVQLEEDAGKSTHPAGKDYSLVDLNRAGTPLLEIVSEPAMHSAAEAKAYARELYLLMRYADVSDADLYHGNMRFDVNVSVSKDNDSLGTRTETKNLNSFRSVEKAVEYETRRQIDVLEKGQQVIQETRGWDDAKQKTFSQRTKEEAEDYRYFPDPDLPPVIIDEAAINEIQATMPIMPSEWRRRLAGAGLENDQIELLLDAQIEQQSDYLGLLESSMENSKRIQLFANWMINIEVPLRRENKLMPTDSSKHQSIYEGVLQLIDEDKLNSNRAKDLLQDLLKESEEIGSYEKYAEEKGYIQLSDESEIASIVAEVIADNPQAAKDVQAGEMKAIGFLVGQVMKASKGKANPQLAQKLIKSQLDHQE